jgi:cytochrome c peroxidase
VPTVRNVDKRPSPDFVKSFTHNGYFKTLKGLVHFYNTRDTKPACPNPLASEAEALAQNCWPEAEVKQNVNKDELGDLKLTEAEEQALVAFMKTLSDGYSQSQ